MKSTEQENVTKDTPEVLAADGVASQAPPASATVGLVRVPAGSQHPCAGRYGVIALEPVQAGQRLGEYTGRRCTDPGAFAESDYAYQWGQALRIFFHLFSRRLRA